MALAIQKLGNFNKVKKIAKNFWQNDRAESWNIEDFKKVCGFLCYHSVKSYYLPLLRPTFHVGSDQFFIRIRYGFIRACFSSMYNLLVRMIGMRNIGDKFNWMGWQEAKFTE